MAIIDTVRRYAPHLFLAGATAMALAACKDSGKIEIDVSERRARSVRRLVRRFVVREPARPPDHRSNALPALSAIAIARTPSRSSSSPPSLSP